MMHSRHATSATQEALDALLIKFPPCRLAITSTPMEPTPSPAGPESQDTPLPNAPTTAREEMEGWKTVQGKTMQRKKKKNKAIDQKCAMGSY
jgi:hypothetical protein